MRENEEEDERALFRLEGVVTMDEDERRSCDGVEKMEELRWRAEWPEPRRVS